MSKTIRIPSGSLPNRENSEVVKRTYTLKVYLPFHCFKKCIDDTGESGYFFKKRGFRSDTN